MHGQYKPRIFTPSCCTNLNPEILLCRHVQSTHQVIRICPQFLLQIMAHMDNSSGFRNIPPIYFGQWRISLEKLQLQRHKITYIYWSALSCSQGITSCHFWKMKKCSRTRHQGRNEEGSVEKSHWFCQRRSGQTSNKNWLRVGKKQYSLQCVRSQTLLVYWF